MDPDHPAAWPIGQRRVVGGTEGIRVIAVTRVLEHETLTDPEVAGRRRHARLPDPDGCAPDGVAVHVEVEPHLATVDDNRIVGHVKRAQRAPLYPSRAAVRPPRNPDPHP